MKKLLFTLLILIVILPAQSEEDVVVDDLLSRVEKATIPLFKGWTEEQILGYASINSNAIESKSYIPAILLLWINKQYDQLELLWWKSEESSKRTLVVACYVAATAERGDFRAMKKWPGFEGNLWKFNEEQKLARKQEIEYVKKNRAAFETAIKNIMNPRANQ